MSDITIMQALNKTVIATKNYVDRIKSEIEINITDTDLNQVIFDVYGFTDTEPTITYSEDTKTFLVTESFVTYNEPTKTLTIRGLEL